MPPPFVDRVEFGNRPGLEVTGNPPYTVQSYSDGGECRAAMFVFTGDGRS